MEQRTLAMPPQSPGTLRLFYALVPEGAVRDALGELARGVALRAHGKVVAARNVHLTLAFLGDVPASTAGALASIGDALPRTPFTLRLDRVGGFRASGVAWAGVGSTPSALVALHAALNDGLARGGFPIEDRPFRAHATLARKCRRVLRESIEPPLDWPVDAVALVSSTLAPGGSVYRTLASWPLDGPPRQDDTGTV